MSFLALALLATLAAARLEPKMRNGAPATMAAHRLPSPAAHDEHEFSALYELYGSPDSGEFVATVNFPCDSSELLKLSVVSPLVDSAHLPLRIDLTAPDGSAVSLGNATRGSWPLNDDGTDRIRAFDLAISSPQIGQYVIRVATSLNAATLLDSPIPVQKHAMGVLIVFNQSPVEIFTHLATYALEVGLPVGLVSHVTDHRHPNVQAAVGVVDFASMSIISPDGTERDIEMRDDGLHADGAANDGVYGALFVPSEAGSYVWRAHMIGHSDDGHYFERTTQHMVRVAQLDVELAGTADILVDSGRVAVSLNVVAPPTAPTATNDVHSYAELWTDSGVAVAWASATTSIVNGAVVLTFDARWLVRAGIDLNALANGSLSFVLKNVYISELVGFVPLSSASEIVPVGKSDVHRAIASLAAAAVDVHIDDELLHFGPRPQWVDDAVAANAATHVILVHGYCSSSNPFVGSGHSWQSAHVFQDFNQNIANDEFAKRIDKFADAKGVVGYAGIGHSQGGIALVHLRSTYWSGLDVKFALDVAAGANRRLIQSVGSPYGGCSGAGSGANLIKMFGVACGANSDLTVDGATLWLATVAEAAAKNAFYYSTIAKKNTGWFDGCNFATNLVLDSPNDGTTEYIRTALPGGNNMGVTEKQCHTEGMNYPAQTADAARNRLMDSFAI